MSVLITGAGLVGSQVARLEQEAGRTPVIFDVAPRADAATAWAHRTFPAGGGVTGTVATYAPSPAGAG